MLKDIITLCHSPVVRSHGGVKGGNDCGGSRNLADEQIIAIANTGGVIGIGYWLSGAT